MAERGLWSPTVIEQALALSALVVALSALIFSILESQRSENFYRASIMPVIVVGEQLSEGSYNLAAYNLSNNSALIKWVALAAPDKELQHVDEIYELVGTSPAAMSFAVPPPESAIAPNDKLLIFTEKDSEASRVVWENRMRFNVQICYCSVLGDCKVGQIRGFANNTIPAVDTCEANRFYEQKLLMPPSFTRSDQ